MPRLTPILPRSIIDQLPPDMPVILEPLIDEGQSSISSELDKAAALLQPEVSGAVSHG